MFSWAVLSSAAPDNLVPAKTSTKIPFVQVIKDGAQIEMRSLVAQIQLALHRQLWMSKLPFCLFLLLGHGDPPKARKWETNLVGSKSGDKQSGDVYAKIVVSYLSTAN